MLRFRRESMTMRTTTTRNTAASALIAAFAGLTVAAALAQSGGYGYGGGQAGPGGRIGGKAEGGGQEDGRTINGMPPGVGYNNSGGEISRQALQQAAIAPEYHMHMSGPTAADAVGSGGGPPISAGGEQPGYVQAKFVTPYGNATVMHHYGPGYPPPIGTPSAGPNDGNSWGGVIANGTVAGNPGMVNWGMTPAWTREEIGNGAWFGGAAGGSGSPVPYVGSFND
jgi:hypothetical protein